MLQKNGINPDSLTISLLSEGSVEPSALSEAAAALATIAGTVLGQIRCGSWNATDWKDLETALLTLPLSTAEFALAGKRLANARAYFEAGENGAASFEIRTMLSTLLNSQEMVVREYARH